MLPEVEFHNAKALYLSDGYRKALEDFLGPDPSAEESRKRMEFLNRQVKILRGHRGGWHLETHPEVRRMVFSDNGTRVAVDFRFGYGGMEVTFEKSGGRWIREKESGINFWIE